MSRCERIVGAVAAAITLAGSPWIAASGGGALVSQDDAHAPATLRETGLYRAGGGGDEIAACNRAFAPQYPLWSDGATKRRWVYLPAGATIDVTRVDAWDFPVGTKFWKEFTFDGLKVETRLLWKASADRWIAASYVWSPDGRDAVLAPAEGMRAAAATAGRSHDIPSVADCAACHGGQRFRPLGFTALQLSTDRDPDAIHGEALRLGMVTLQTLVAEHLTSPERPELVSHPPRISSRDAATRTVLGYLSANCSSCHNGEGDVAALGPVLRQRDLLQDGDAVARALLNQPTTWQVPGAPPGASVLVDPAAPESSAILVRMRSRRPSSQMPPLGTTRRDDEAVDAITRWIASRAPLPLP
jgi:mono/diheme cytochrome c family protein